MVFQRSSQGVLQKRAVRKNGFTADKRRVFLETLAATCNAKRAAAAAGIDRSAVYRLRHGNAEFAALWVQAMDAGSERLDEEVLAVAAGQPRRWQPIRRSAPTCSRRGRTAWPWAGDNRP
jgi:hypothetical protein